MQEAIGAYRTVTATDTFKELERLRSRARHNEASALGHARREERKKWQGVIAQKDATHAAVLADKDATHAAVIANKDAENEKLRKQLAELQAKMDD